MKKILAVLFGTITLAACQNAPKVQEASANKPVVYFTRDISPEGLVKIYDKISGLSLFLQRGANNFLDFITILLHVYH